MQEAQALSIEDAFGELRDPHSRTPAHDLSEMLVVALCATLSGGDSWVAIQIWGDVKLEWQRGYVPLRNGIPSHDTFGRVFAARNPRQFEACFTRWMSCAFPTLSGELIVIDGKTVRAAHRNGGVPSILFQPLEAACALYWGRCARPTRVTRSRRFRSCSMCCYSMAQS
ncbi:hypothetical protein WT94_15350 [Burkholderia stagnalis]|nr:ISAs1 family transposase [Burkholderia stagnalis]KWK08662.1 hypothetical protein WT76_11255 [Burkholderia stagnalis]KWO24165.1 hypothetical protein WT94_15350 [Burkholderia stagnalis]